MKLSQSLSILTLLVASTAAVGLPHDNTYKKCLTEGTFCEGFAGSVGTCCKGLVCENEPFVADDAHCKKVWRRRRKKYELYVLRYAVENENHSPLVLMTLSERH
ncbi:hypothetical protein SBOR_2241 [Sclerotinia borealis F-4128]|uniref:Uncharacterized protein n=1 Tax=Sclerotinia borealis (strain F-4128) TaxID=1432307 RepID=W9CKQ1_SCLBF|nr:hypothetical protein SBOR_2241 [Sclerotinia borealis F-4128]